MPKINSYVDSALNPQLLAQKYNIATLIPLISDSQPYRVTAFGGYCLRGEMHLHRLV